MSGTVISLEEWSRRTTRVGERAAAAPLAVGGGYGGLAAPAAERVTAASRREIGLWEAPPRRRRASAKVRRRRATLAVVAVALTLLALPTGGHRAAVGTPIRPGTEYVVQPGDSLWSIGERVSGGADVRDLVDAMAGQLGTTTVQPGEIVRVP